MQFKELEIVPERHQVFLNKQEVVLTGKEFQIKQYSNANSVIEKMAIAYLSDKNLRREIDNWTNDSNKITANLGYSIYSGSVVKTKI